MRLELASSSCLCTLTYLSLLTTISMISISSLIKLPYVDRAYRPVTYTQMGGDVGQTCVAHQRVPHACDLNIPEVAVTLAILVRLLAHCP